MKPLLIIFFACLLISQSTQAIDEIELDIQTISPIKLKNHWLLKQAKLKLLNPFSKRLQLSLLLPLQFKLNNKKFNYQLTINCSKITIAIYTLHCSKGELKIKDKQLKRSKPLIYTLDLLIEKTANTEKLKLSLIPTNQKKKPIKLNLSRSLNPSRALKPNRSFNLNHNKTNVWRLSLNAKNQDISTLSALYKKLLFDKKYQQLQINELSGLVSLDLQAKILNNSIKQLDTSLSVKQLNLEGFYQQQEMLAENFNFSVNSSLKIKSKDFSFSTQFSKLLGASFIDPAYIEFNGNEIIKLSGKYFANRANKPATLHLNNIHIATNNNLKFNGQSTINLAENKITNSKISLNISSLEQFNQNYLANLLSGTSYEGLIVKGNFVANYNKTMQHERVSIKPQQFSLSHKNIAELKDLAGEINWQNKAVNPISQVKPSVLTWDTIQLNKIKIEKSQIDFSLDHNQFKLLKRLSLPLFNSQLLIYRLSAKDIFSDPNIIFDGLVKPISLSLLSQHFKLPLLDGTLSAVIPTTQYYKKRLRLGGDLIFSVFDGQLRFKQVNLENGLSDYSRLSSDISFLNIDLSSLTKTYNFGRIEGRLEGEVNGLVLDNWQPSQFSMWLKTPQNDSSKHLISQTAIDNISSMGGLQAALSSTFLSFFENFRYEKLGISCILKQGNCQMGGVESKDTGSYYLVKGSGLPRIDVMGYQRQVDWKVLLNRLSAIRESNKIIIK